MGELGKKEGIFTEHGMSINQQGFPSGEIILGREGKCITDLGHLDPM